MYMSFYEDLVTQTQMNFERYYGVYASGRTPYQLAEKSRCRITSRFVGWCGARLTINTPMLCASPV